MRRTAQSPTRIRRRVHAGLRVGYASSIVHDRRQPGAAEQRGGAWIGRTNAIDEDPGSASLPRVRHGGVLDRRRWRSAPTTSAPARRRRNRRRRRTVRPSRRRARRRRAALPRRDRRRAPSGWPTRGRSRRRSRRRTTRPSGTPTHGASSAPTARSTENGSSTHDHAGEQPFTRSRVGHRDPRRRRRGRDRRPRPRIRIRRSDLHPRRFRADVLRVAVESC